jgi:phage terminase large subunit GpA-like protein
VLFSILETFIIIIYNKKIHNIFKISRATRLQVPDPGPAYINFPCGEDGAEIQGSSFDCLKTFCCERWTDKTINGYTQYIWTKPAHRRNQGIDTFAYARGALLHLGGGRILEYDAERRQKLNETPKPEEKPRLSRCGHAPVMTYTKLRAEQTGRVASGRSLWSS